VNWLAVGGIAAAVLLLRRKAQAASASCKPCYDDKSMAYQNCMQIPVENRAARGSCFNGADIAFDNCLRSCGG